MIQQLYHVGQHGDFDNSFRAVVVAVRPAVVPRRRGQPRRSDGEIEEVIDGFVDAAARARARRLRRRGDLRRLPRLRRPVLVAVVEPARRSLGWLVRGPDALLGDDPRTHPCRRRRRLRDRSGRQRRSDGGCPAEPGRAVRDRRLARRARADGLRHLRHGQLRRLLRHHPDPPIGRQPRRRDGRRAVQGGAPRQGPGREPRPHGGERRRRVGAGRRRPRVDRPRSDRRPPPRGQGAGRPATGRAHLHLLQPDVLGTAVARLLDLVPRQPVGRSGGRVGWRPVHRGRRAGAGAGRRRRSRRARGGPHRRRTRPHRHARRGDEPARRRVPPRRPAATAGPDPRPAGLVRTPARAARRRRAAGYSSRRRRRRRHGRRPRRGGHGLATGRHRLPASACRCRRAPGCRRTERVPRRGRPRRARRRRSPRRGPRRRGRLARWRHSPAPAEQGHDVVIVTGHPMVGATIQRTAGDGRLRARLAARACSGTPRPR